jgi:hypothetical protein
VKEKKIRHSPDRGSGTRIADITIKKKYCTFNDHLVGFGKDVSYTDSSYSTPINYSASIDRLMIARAHVQAPHGTKET